MTVSFDLEGATADEIVFEFASIKYRYNIADQKLMYQGVQKNKFGSKNPPALRPDSNKILKIRMLVDWSSIEIFSEEGVFSLSHHVAFNPKDDSLNLSTKGGSVNLLSLELNQINSIWKQ